MNSWYFLIALFWITQSFFLFFICILRGKKADKSINNAAERERMLYENAAIDCERATRLSSETYSAAIVERLRSLAKVEPRKIRNWRKEGF